MKHLPAKALLAILVLLVAPLAAEAQATGQRHRIGFLNGATGGGAPDAAIREGLRTLGYVEGINLVIETRAALGRVERLPVLVRELLDTKPEVIVTFGTTAAQAAKAGTTTTPIVMAFAGDPVGDQIVTNLARPGGNVTGMSLASSDVSGKRLQLLKEVVPKLNRLTVLGDISRQAEIQETEKAARALGVTVALVELTRADGLDSALADVSRTRPQSVLVLNSAVTITHRARIIEFTLKNRVPLVGTQSPWADGGALIAYAPSVVDSCRRAATYVDKILKGANPGDLPVQQPTKFDLVLNRKSARALGLTIPPSLLARADRMIE